MRKFILFIVVCLSSLSLPATENYMEKIAGKKKDADMAFRPVAAKFVARYYGEWAQDSISAGHYSGAVKIYQNALQDTFLKLWRRTQPFENDEHTDKMFAEERSRFPGWEEDVLPTRLTVADYATFL